MARSQPAIWIVVALWSAFAALGGAPGLAQQPLPTPRGQLGGREPLEPTGPAGIEIPLPPTPAPGFPVADSASRETERLASMASVAARSTVVVRIWRGNEVSELAGWASDSAGHVVTASGDVETADRITVAATAGVWVDAALLDADPAIGVAVLAVPGLAAPPLALPSARAGRGDAVAAVRPAPDRGRDPAWSVGTTRPIEPGEVVLVELTDEDGRWTPGAPVVAESGLVGMALPAGDPQAAAGATAARGTGSPEAPPTGRLAAFVPIETIRVRVSALIQ